MKTLIVDGRLGRDAEIKTTKGGTKYVKFTMANNEFEHGEVVTTWYDVVTYSDFTIEHQANILKTGTFVQVVGTPSEDVNQSKDGRCFLNHSIMAINIDIPSFKKKSEDEQEVSTYTASTKQTKTVIEEKQVEVKEEPKINVGIVTDEGESDDDLPF